MQPELLLIVVVAFCVGLAAGVLVIARLHGQRFEGDAKTIAERDAQVAELTRQLAVARQPASAPAAAPPKEIVRLTAADHRVRISGLIAEAKVLADSVPQANAAASTPTEWVQRVQRWTADARGYLADNCSIRAGDRFVDTAGLQASQVERVHPDLLSYFNTLRHRSRNLAEIMDNIETYSS